MNRHESDLSYLSILKIEVRLCPYSYKRVNYQKLIAPGNRSRPLGELWVLFSG
jgi:hypothetical protein